MPRAHTHTRTHSLANTYRQRHRHEHHAAHSHISVVRREPKKGVSVYKKIEIHSLTPMTMAEQNYKIQKVIRLSMAKNALVACFRWFRLGVRINLFVRNAHELNCTGPTRMQWKYIVRLRFRVHFLLCMNWRVHGRYMYMHCLVRCVVLFAKKKPNESPTMPWKQCVRAHTLMRKCPRAHNLLAEVCFSLKF